MNYFDQLERIMEAFVDSDDLLEKVSIAMEEGTFDEIDNMMNQIRSANANDPNASGMPVNTKISEFTGDEEDDEGLDEIGNMMKQIRKANTSTNNASNQSQPTDGNVDQTQQPTDGGSTDTPDQDYDEDEEDDININGTQVAGDNVGEDDVTNDPSIDNNNGNTQSEPQTDEDIKNDIRVRMETLLDLISSNLTSLNNASCEQKMHNNRNYSIILNKLETIKTLLLKFITEKKYLEKDVNTYTKYFVTCNEIHNLCLSMLKEYFDEYRMQKKENNKKINKAIKHRFN